MSSDEMKRKAALAALKHLPETGVLGLGTGSTTRWFIEAVGELVRGGRTFSCVPTSLAMESSPVSGRPSALPTSRMADRAR